MSSFLPSTDLGANITITNEEFNLFHNIDRQLFTRFVVGLGRDTSQCCNIMAFIMWLEKKTKDFSMVSNLLLWPDNLLHDIAEEAIIALNCIESVQFPYAQDKVLPLILNISHGSMTLQYLHENRLQIISAVTKLLNDVCIRAFTDIVHQVQHERAMKHQSLNVPNFIGTISNPSKGSVLYYAPTPGVAIVPQQILVAVPQWNLGNVSPSLAGGVKPYDIASRNDSNEEFKDVLGKLQISSAAIAREMKEVPADDRTIFMTFSKGYPIFESEIREFFQRSYGDIIEAIHMQDVPPMEQPLFACMVVRLEAMPMIDSFLDGTDTVKFSINGKHVWARRYVRRGDKSPRATSPVTFKPPSPSAGGTSY